MLAAESFLERVLVREAFELAAESLYEEFYEKFGRENIETIRAYRTTPSR